MAYCPECSTEHLNDLTTCMDCGTKLVAEQPAEFESPTTFRMLISDYFPVQIEKSEKDKRIETILLILIAALGLYFLLSLSDLTVIFIRNRAWDSYTAIEAIGSIVIVALQNSFGYLLYAMLVTCIGVMVIRYRGMKLIRITKCMALFYAGWSFVGLVCGNLLMATSSVQAYSATGGQVISANIGFMIHVLIGLLLFAVARKTERTL